MEPKATIRPTGDERERAVEAMMRQEYGAIRARDNPHGFALREVRDLFAGMVIIAARAIDRDRDPAFPDMGAVAHWVKALRYETGLTQADLARKLGVYATTVSKWERGEQRPRKDTLAKLRLMAAARHLPPPPDDA